MGGKSPLNSDKYIHKNGNKIINILLGRDVMNKEFSNKNIWKSGVFGAVFTVVGIGFIMFIPLIGYGIIALGVILFFLIRYFSSNTTVIIEENGFSVKVFNKRKGTILKSYHWLDVVETKYYERETAGEDPVTISYFQVKTGEGVAFTLQEMKGFHELIALVNQHTLHLPYYWAKPKGVFGQYKKQSRG